MLENLKNPCEGCEANTEGNHCPVMCCELVEYQAQCELLRDVVDWLGKYDMGSYDNIHRTIVIPLNKWEKLEQLLKEVGKCG